MRARGLAIIQIEATLLGTPLISRVVLQVVDGLPLARAPATVGS